MNDSDRVRRFVLERHPIRCHSVRLSRAWLELREHQQYPSAVQDLLGEAVSAAVLLAATLKFDGTLTLQLQGAGLVNLLVAQCTHDFRVRAMARFGDVGDQAGFAALAGEGRVLVTVEATDRASSYQGVVPIAGNSLAESLEAYFHQSEQLPTRVALSASPGLVAGMLLQQLPESGGNVAGADEEVVRRVWQHAQTSMTAMPRGELLTADVEQRLVEMFGAGEVRAFAGHEVRFECRCSRERVANVLRALGREEVDSVIAEQQAVTVTCEFCQKPYRFDAIDVRQLFGEPPPSGSGAIN